MKILQGTSEAANQAHYAAKGLKELGYSADYARYVDSEFFLSADYNFAFDKSKKLRYPIYAARMFAFASRAAREYDVFHFHRGYSLLLRNLDLPLLDDKGKKYFFEYHGSEIRQGAGWEANPYCEHLPEYFSNPVLVERAKRQLEKSAGAIVHDAEMGLYIPDIAPVYYVPLRVDIKQFTPSYPSADSGRKPLVVHAPSNRSVKGTEYIIAAVEELSSDYDFDFKLVENTSQEEAFKIYSQADVVIDQLFIGTYGVLSIEAMALGKPVMAFIRPDLTQTYPDWLPVVSVTKETIKDRLSYLLDNPAERERLGREGRRYVETYHDYKKIAKLLYSLYESGDGCLTARESYDVVARL